MKLSISSFVISILGLFIAYMIFPPFNIDYLGPHSMLWIPIGFFIYLIGMSLAVYAFVKKEPGFMKYVALSPLVLGGLFLAFLTYLFGGEI
ncbi:hypothetical protein AB5N96_08220 [Chryseomicrobium imtechense]